MRATFDTLRTLCLFVRSTAGVGAARLGGVRAVGASPGFPITLGLFVRYTAGVGAARDAAVR